MTREEYRVEFDRRQDEVSALEEKLHEFSREYLKSLGIEQLAIVEDNLGTKCWVAGLKWSGVFGLTPILRRFKKDGTPGQVNYGYYGPVEDLKVLGKLEVFPK